MARRRPLAFASVNQPGRADYDPHYQRHHLLPCQVLHAPRFAGLMGGLGSDRIGFHDFRRNGMLLPATEQAASRSLLPLHRGPHPRYSELVSERIGQIEAAWASSRRRNADAAAHAALFRLDLLQRALRRRLLDPYRSGVMALNRRDPALDRALDYTHLDAMVDQLWQDSGDVASA